MLLFLLFRDIRSENVHNITKCGSIYVYCRSCGVGDEFILLAQQRVLALSLFRGTFLEGIGSKEGAKKSD